MDVTSIVVGAIISLATGLASMELKDWSDRLARRLVRRAVSQLPTEFADRYRDEWLTADQITSDRDAWKKADCSNCHGWSGNGHDTGPVPPGPSLRDTQLEYNDIRETIACGRPSTSMPSHDRLAWGVDKCYGMSAADVGHGKPQKGTPLRPEEIDAIAAYVAGYLKGRGPTAKAECEDYFGAGNAACSSYQ